jgi:threonine dehydratase
MILKEQLVTAHNDIKAYIKRTPVLTSAYLDASIGAQLFFKCENFQEVGAFKMRGAMNAVLGLTPAQRARGVATHSSGNHAQALARAAFLTGTKAYVVMPENATAIKKEGVKGFGAEIFECAPGLAGRESKIREVLEMTGAVEIHPFNNNAVITGQATAAKELFEQVEGLDIVIAPIGGGGLISGTALAAHYFSPETRVIGGEPSGADDAFRSLQSGKIEQSQARSVADGLLSNLGEKTFEIIKAYVNRIITVDDAEILNTMQLLLERLKILVEPSGAVPLAAVLRDPGPFKGKRVGIILSGGNIDLENFCMLTVKTTRP